MTESEQELIAAADSDFLRNARQPVGFEMDLASLIQLIGMLQLACRHPGISDDLRAAAERFVNGCEAGFRERGWHGLAALVRAGWIDNRGAR